LEMVVARSQIGRRGTASSLWQRKSHDHPGLLRTTSLPRSTVLSERNVLNNLGTTSFATLLALLARYGKDSHLFRAALWRYPWGTHDTQSMNAEVD
jgi:hypothetical protein